MVLLRSNPVPTTWTVGTRSPKRWPCHVSVSPREAVPRGTERDLTGKGVGSTHWAGRTLRRGPGKEAEKGTYHLPPLGRRFSPWLVLQNLVSTPTGASSAAEGKAPACNAGDAGSIPGLGSSPGEGNGNPLQYPCLENPTDGRAWWAKVHGITKSRTRLSELTSLHFNRERIRALDMLNRICHLIISPEKSTGGALQHLQSGLQNLPRKGPKPLKCAFL